MGRRGKPHSICTEVDVMTDALIHPGKEIALALGRAYEEWKNWQGKKYLYFEHHCEDLYGCTFTYDYTRRMFYSWRITDEQKYMLFLMKFL